MIAVAIFLILPGVALARWNIQPPEKYGQYQTNERRC